MIKAEVPDDHMLAAVFNGREIINWHRIQDLQFMSLKLLAVQLLLASPDYDKKSLSSRFSERSRGKNAPLEEPEMPLYISGELTSYRWNFNPPVTLYASPNNPGADGAAIALKEGLLAVNGELSPSLLM